ncbi:prepilin-type N-terminal cleavage/methylation domain-containing protein [Tepidimonas taiwanensis]|uniref:prepilin-type N-terminal cleavage/methylation domain-containing protein n=1 Tax=Tepidimonas taiwanensis TaxID=307486 RepID=UPI0009E81D18|nr:prepilin-type N-terminal cleavage/methylation domain-containing protein [Tepidimonas taiwanensis]
MSLSGYRRIQGGFTLVEIAIVLVIIGLLLGGVLKGQELIENGRVKEATNTMNGVIAAYNGYYDRYKRLPGDDGPAGTLTARGAAWTGIAAGDADGSIEVTAAQTFTGAGEQDEFWRHLRAAGLVTGSPADIGAAALPRNAWGGLIGITNDVTQGRTAARLQICFGNVPGKAAAQLDTNLDDGRPDNGSIRATLGANNQSPAGAAATGYNEGQTYTICRDMV